MSETIPDLTLYTVVNFQEGKGAGEQHVLASSVESAIKMFYRKFPNARISGVLVDDKIVYYGAPHEATESEGS